MIRLLGTVLLAAALAACGQQAPASAPPPAHTGHHAVSATATTAAADGSFDATARAFVELVIATDDQAVKLMDLGARATSPALRQLAGDLGARRRGELATLRGILDTAGVSYVDNHAGHDMPGMPTEAELTALAAAGAGFDAEFVRLVRAHLTESVTVAQSGTTSVGHEETRTAAESMARERAAALQALDGLG